MRTVTGPTDHVVVVGAGLAGLAAALHLAGRGRQVTVVERGDTPGGRTGRMDVDGYRIDTGPTVLTMPELIEEPLAAVGSSLTERLELTRLDPAYRARFADGSTLDVHADPDAMAEAITDFAGSEEADGYRRLRRWLAALYRAEFDRFIATNTDSPLSLLTPSLGRLVAMGAFRRLDAAVSRFLSDERLRRVFTFQSLYAGQAPHDALAVYAVIAYMDTVAGVYFPRGGMRALPDALAAAAEAAGVRFAYGSTVTSLERTGSRLRAVRTDTELRVPCDAVVLTCELPAAYELVGRAPRRVVPLRPAPSAVVLHVGTRRGLPDTTHHTLSFGAAWQDTFAEIIDGGRVMSDPSLLVTRPSVTDPALAPDGRDLWYVLAPAPNLRQGPIDWDAAEEDYAQHLLATVAERLLPGLPDSVEMTRLVTPAEWSRQGMVAGTPFSYAHTFAQTGPFRPANLPHGVDNAVLAGCATVPGVGVPTALVSGRLAADRVTGAPVASGSRRSVV
ncbi:MAG: phytoene desaturase family protein [Streptosporangiales bacterium]